MDWKTTPWDLEDFEQNAEPIIGGSGVSPSGGLIGHHRGRIDCSVDLKLGGLGDFGSSEKWREQSTISITTSSSSGSSKRARSSGNCTQNAACLVEGCKSDLSNSREYHRRHKVCEIHSKTPIVIVGGQEQRFCQQCSRFHLLVEFDEVKRSCRKRLDGHNRRRRKPQPESIDSGSLFFSHQGSTTSRYSSYPQIFPSATSEPTWENIIKTGEDSIYNAHQRPPHFIDAQPPHFPTSSIGYRDRKQFPFSQDGNGFRVFANDLTQVLGSDCVLSLLSSPTQAPGVNVGQLAPADRIPVGQPLVSSFSYGGLGRWSPQLQAPHNVSATGFSCSAIEEDADIQCEGMMFRVGDEGSSDGASMQALPFFQQ